MIPVPKRFSLRCIASEFASPSVHCDLRFRWGLVALLASLLTLGGVAAERETEPSFKLRAVVELTDGSRLVGVPLDRSLRVTQDSLTTEIPLERIRTCEVRREDGQIVLNLQNGDKLAGFTERNHFRLETTLGPLAPPFVKVLRIAFTTAREGNMPAGEGAIFFGGVNWLVWRTMFEVQGDKLVSLPKVRPGFNYGHGGNGRGPTLMSNIGSPDWKDYCVEFEYCVTGMDPRFNPGRIPADYHDGAIYFHVADAKESWNERGQSLYYLWVLGNGAWVVSSLYNEHCRTPVGYGPPHRDGARQLATGNGLKIDRVNGNKFRIELRGQRISIWVDGKQLVEVTDDKMGEKIAGQTLDHGGVGFHWGLDTMGWIRNFSARAL